MALRNVVKMGDETLRKKCKRVEKFDENLWVLLDDMFETMNKNNDPAIKISGKVRDLLLFMLLFILIVT